MAMPIYIISWNSFQPAEHCKPSKEQLLNLGIPSALTVGNQRNLGQHSFLNLPSIISVSRIPPNLMNTLALVPTTGDSHFRCGLININCSAGTIYIGALISGK